MAKLPWTPWHKVVELRADLKSGELPLHIFAADLYEVLMQSGKRRVYENAEEFFGLTFPTHNLRALVRDVVLRLAGKNDKAVRQLELTYGGGKTHTLITLRHLVHKPEALPNLPAVEEFVQTIGQRPPRARVAGLCFDKLDVETGTAVRSPEGVTRRLMYPWSVLAFQIEGDDGLKVLHAHREAKERETAPAENVLTELLEIPAKKGLGVLILIDEVLMYAREKIAQDPAWRSHLVNFFQCLTQAATKVDRCCVVASLLATDPRKSDTLGRQVLNELYDVFRRQKEEGVEPVVKEDVAEVLRRRFFTPASIRDSSIFRPQVIAALQGVKDLDEQTSRHGIAAEKRFLDSYPFHPDLTEVLYEKWTQLSGFQRTRGLLRTFALALREAAEWDECPLVGPEVFLNAPGRAGLSEATRELVAVAETEEHEGKKQAWTGILDGELERARDIQIESIGLGFREIEQAVIGTFLHSQPVGQSARTRDLLLLLSSTRPGKIELEKGLVRWARTSHWLDDRHVSSDESLPGQWRLGNKPNLTQMHAKAVEEVKDEMVLTKLIDEIARTKALTSGAQAAGVRAHILPVRPRDIDDDGSFRYAILGPGGASDSGKPSAEACSFLDEGTKDDRVYRNAVLLLVPSRDGLETAKASVSDCLAWEEVHRELTKKQNDGATLDQARMATLAINLDRSRGRIPEAIKQAYCIVVTVSETNQVQAFRITISDDPAFVTIKGDLRSRVQEKAVTAEALLPGGPYDLWEKGETSRMVKDLAGAFAQLPRLPKMLKARAILDTLVDGCEQGTFVLRLMRPDRTFRTWWKSRPDEAALADPALELVLPHAAELAEIEPELLAPAKLPELWKGDEITVGDVINYFRGDHVVQVQREGFVESKRIPRAHRGVIEAAVGMAVESGKVWLLAAPASLLTEPIPPGVLTDAAVLREPPATIAPAEILPEALPSAWKEESTTALSLATALSAKAGRALPWKTIRDVIATGLQARFFALEPDSGPWPCGFEGAQRVKLQLAGVAPEKHGPLEERKPNVAVATSELEPVEIQDLADQMSSLLDLRARTSLPIRFRLTIELGDGDVPVEAEVLSNFNEVLAKVREGFTLR
ncbi:MAG: ATP-binding protein [Acidobacteria bacterium]|nr:ATP-binding protein [Acidobacteriota bacterium]